MRDFVNWDIISNRWDLDDAFIREFSGYLNWNMLIDRKIVSDNLMRDIEDIRLSI